MKFQDDNEQIFKLSRTDYQSVRLLKIIKSISKIFLLQDPPLPRRRVAKKTTITKDTNTKRNSNTSQRTDELNHYSLPSRQQSQTIIPINNTEVTKILLLLLIN